MQNQPLCDHLCLASSPPILSTQSEEVVAVEDVRHEPIFHTLQLLMEAEESRIYFASFSLEERHMVLFLTRSCWLLTLEPGSKPSPEGGENLLPRTLRAAEIICLSEGCRRYVLEPANLGSFGLKGFWLVGQLDVWIHIYRSTCEPANMSVLWYVNVATRFG
ncbi:hypothetical protein Nepgr_002788 [Nepenthes gracilis]|uniref:Uncharacterized protein n=1 Tax=Nepenthes gracilis TaxID=150966 RepID=A0AAD3RY17_NEPGR|nr:hypothetical protein Nepgr_002788 [Nepenthes gracilis]